MSRLQLTPSSFACALAWASACADGHVCVGSLPAALVYGEDQREDVHEVADEALRRLALESSPALIAPENLVLQVNGRYAVRAEPLGLHGNVCPSERFVLQPTAAACSGVLIADDLVLTAAHCASLLPCREQRWVFGYAEERPGQLRELDEDDVYRCRAIPVSVVQRDAAQRFDFAVVALDRSAHPAPAQQTAPLTAADLLSVIGYPSGLPLKVAAGARVLDPRSHAGDYFSLESDTFDGSSGSGVFDAHGALVGVFLRGGHDWVSSADGAQECFKARRLDVAPEPARAEQAGYLRPALEALCAVGWSDFGACEQLDRAPPACEP